MAIKWKTVQFAYAGSDIADDEGSPDGCWYVAIMNDQHTPSLDIQFSSEDKAKCVAYAVSLFPSLAWSMWSMHEEQFK